MQDKSCIIWKVIIKDKVLAYQELIHAQEELNNKWH